MIVEWRCSCGTWLLPGRKHVVKWNTMHINNIIKILYRSLLSNNTAIYDCGTTKTRSNRIEFQRHIITIYYNMSRIINWESRRKVSMKTVDRLLSPKCIVSIKQNKTMFEVFPLRLSVSFKRCINRYFRVLSSSNVHRFILFVLSQYKYIYRNWNLVKKNNRDHNNEKKKTIIHGLK